MANSDGDSLRSMVIASPKWVHRRIQTIDHTTPGRILLKNSLDVTAPISAKIAGTKSRVIIPIAVLDKRVLSGWWVTDSAGSPLAVISQDRSRTLVQDMLVSFLAQFGIILSTNSAVQKRLLSFINNSEAIAAVAPNALLNAYPQLHGVNPEALFIKDFIQLLSRSWVVLVEVPEDVLGRRIIINYGYDLPSNEVRRPSIWSSTDNDVYSLDVPDPGFSRSLHLQVLVPPELTIFEMSLEHGSASGEVNRAISSAARLGPIAHVQNMNFIPRFAKAAVEFRLRPARGGISAFTRWSLFFSWALIFFSLSIWIGPTEYYLNDDWKSSISSSVILVAPAIFMSWIARAPEPGVLATALVRLRRINILLALSMLTMAGALSVAWSPVIWAVLWVLSYMLGGFALAIWLAEHSARKPRKFSTSTNG